MRVLLSGASGLIGRAVTRALEDRGDTVVRLVRRAKQNDSDIEWNPDGLLNPGKLRQKELGAVVHLAGESIAERWTREKKRRIRDSRVGATSRLSFVLSKLEPKYRPRVLVSASAVGIYGNRGDEMLTEASTLGSGFLAEVAREWEAATEPAQQAGIRVVLPRIAMVLAKDGGALAKMLLPFKLGVGGRVGSGNQYWSWIALYDLVRLILHAIDEQTLSGPVNASAPNPVTNREFTKELARAVHRPAIFPAPAFALRLAFGQMADEVLLSSARVVSQKLPPEFFEHHDLRSALAGILK